MPSIAVKSTIGPHFQNLWKTERDRCSRCRSKFNVTLITTSHTRRGCRWRVAAAQRDDANETP